MVKKERVQEEIKEREDADNEQEAEDAEAEKLQEERTNQMIEEANLAADRIEAANKESAKNLDRHERLKAQEILGGHTEAGSKEKSPEETANESARNLIKGSGFEDIAFPQPEKENDTNKKRMQ